MWLVKVNPLYNLDFTVILAPLLNFSSSTSIDLSTHVVEHLLKFQEISTSL